MATTLSILFWLAAGGGLGWVITHVRWLAKTSDLRAKLAGQKQLADLYREERDLARSGRHPYTPGM